MKLLIALVFATILTSCGLAPSSQVPKIQGVQSQTQAMSIPSPKTQGVQPQAATIPSPTGQWIVAGNSGMAQIYFQPVSSDGNNAKFWMRVDFNQPLQSGDITQLMFQDAECNKGLYHTRYIARFAENSQSLGESSINESTLVSLDSPAGTAFQLTCNARM